MYKDKDLDDLFRGREEVEVIKKNPEKIEEFVEKVNEIYNTTVTHEGWDGEIEFPIRDEEEFFNVKLFINNLKTIKND